MSIVSVRFAIVISSLSLFVFGCGETTEPVEENVDQEVMGAWYYTDEFFADHPAPEVEVQGIHIADDGSLKDLGVETATGKLAVWDTYPTDIYAKDVIVARDGTMIVRYTSRSNDVDFDTLLYTVRNDTLTLRWPDNSVKLVYGRSSLGASVRQPLASEFEVSIDAYSNTPLLAFDIFPYPAAYASRTSESTLLITAWLPQTRITIPLDNFHGVGDYTVSEGQYVLEYHAEDYIRSFVSDSAAGTITIEQYDEAANVCSGRFALRVHSTSETLELKEGRFVLPVYR